MDRTSHTSVLSPVESHRFHRAMYRLMLVAKVFPASDFDEEDDDPDPVVVQRQQLARKDLLADFVDTELFELHSASLFLIETIEWLSQADGPGLRFPLLDSGDIALVVGPAMVLQAYKDLSLDSVMHDFYDIEDVPAIFVDYLSGPLNRIWEERKTKPPANNPTHWASLLNEIRGDQDTYWDYLRLSCPLALYRLHFLVKGRIAQNVDDGPLLSSKIREFTSHAPLLRQVFQVLSPAWNALSATDWLCEACIVLLIQEHLHLWLLERKREDWLNGNFEDGIEIRDDCWYGYNCRTQTHSVHHAQRVNPGWREGMSQIDDDSNFFERERDRLAREITTQGFEELLSSTNVLNRKLEEVLGMTKEYDTIAELWQSFYRLMRGPTSAGEDDREEKMLGLPGTGGHVVAMKQSKGGSAQ
ncbi:hypothetical protein H0H93_004306 [Arthromyces matolae]|nr:hypothetical protein H0H93_004306 [Arthromyces matolae]